MLQYFNAFSLTSSCVNVTIFSRRNTFTARWDKPFRWTQFTFPRNALLRKYCFNHLEKSELVTIDPKWNMSQINNTMPINKLSSQTKSNLSIFIYFRFRPFTRPLQSLYLLPVSRSGQVRVVDRKLTVYRFKSFNAFIGWLINKRIPGWSAMTGS